MAHSILEKKNVKGEWFDVTPKDAVAAVEKALKAVREHGEGAYDMLCLAEARANGGNLGSPWRPNVQLPYLVWRAVTAHQVSREIGTQAEALCRLVLAGLDAADEIARLRALLAAAGVDADGDEGGPR